MIDKCVEKGMEEEDIIKYCMSDSVFNEEEVTKNFEMYMEYLHESRYHNTLKQQKQLLSPRYYILEGKRKCMGYKNLQLSIGKLSK